MDENTSNGITMNKFIEMAEKDYEESVKSFKKRMRKYAFAWTLGVLSNSTSMFINIWQNETDFLPLNIAGLILCIFGIRSYFRAKDILKDNLDTLQKSILDMKKSLET